MLKTKVVEIKLKGSKKISHYKEKGYELPYKIDKYGRIVIDYSKNLFVKVEDLPKGSEVCVNCECDGCGELLENIRWIDYLRCVKEDGKYYCKKCAKNNYNKWINFEEWCLEHNRQDALDRWDYDLNHCKPSEITYSSNKKYYFKCPRGLHESELKLINSYTNGQEGSIECKKCGSFAQWDIDNLGEDFLEKYWDWEKNKISPWEISYGSEINKVWIKCQEKNYHESYLMPCKCFVRGDRCPYCNNQHGKVHPLDSLGKLLKDKGLLHLWSEKNKRSPYEYTPRNDQKVYWKCPEGKHKDYLRSILNSNICNFRCPECQYSKGEERISNDLINNKGFVKISQQEFEQLFDKIKYNKDYYIPQKEFKGLIGLKGGLLSYDFYLPKYNLLIEYQGEQHERYIPGFHNSEDDFKRQLDHDRRKREYAKLHNIKLLEIWYWDFNKIEEILTRELNTL